MIKKHQLHPHSHAESSSRVHDPAIFSRFHAPRRKAHPRRLFIITTLSLLLLLTASLTLAQSTNPTEAMMLGNQHYEAGQFAEAIQAYETILAQGIQNGALYYNLANAYYKSGDLGRAILNYRRAQYLDPRDADIAANLAIVRLQTLDQLEKSDEGVLTNTLKVIEEWLTLSEALFAALILWLLICTFTIIAILSTRLRRFTLWAIAILALSLIIGLFSTANRYYLLTTTPPAVIIALETDVTSGPGPAEQYLVEFNLHAGAEVRLMETRPNWRRIALPGLDFQGWVPAKAVELIVVE